MTWNSHSCRQGMNCYAQQSVVRDAHGIIGYYQVFAMAYWFDS